MLYVKYLNDNSYDMCSFNKDGNLYILQKVRVPRGMGNQTAIELLIMGMNKKKIDGYLRKENAVIVSRETEPELRILNYNDKAKNNITEDKLYYHGTYEESEYHPYSTNRFNRFSKWNVSFKNAKKKGNWIILENGSKKRLDKCKIERTTKRKIK